MKVRFTAKFEKQVSKINLQKNKAGYNTHHSAGGGD
jgi:hypothetical protein